MVSVIQNTEAKVMNDYLKSKHRRCEAALADAFLRTTVTAHQEIELSFALVLG